ncbi:BspA family leucine-rich repeat surface protein [Ichthyobacterium seriolicida]|uniref:PKD domain-containing protein n=1 Tax=Ichthyobacterium seriolicida TaxID=242600 RepID=A0A1J1EBZ7_9FLAO|nr:BspA family leucine-rich repeat surface protein [Ichthyobacterium seriolicida]BAV95467.1 hypothetical protein JBKA6_1454 [Ichthyobacterium seriolicida]
MKSKILLFYLFVFQIMSFTSCTKEKKVENTSDEVKNSSDTVSLTSFSLKFDSDKNKDLSKDIKGVIDSKDSTKISVVLPYKKRELRKNLVPTIKFIGKKIEPDPSKITDFSKSVAFTITSEKGESKTYTVTVSLSEPSSENKILSFKFKADKNNGLSKDIEGVIDSEDSTKISVALPHSKGKLKTNLVPIIGFAGETIKPDPSKITDFTNPVAFTITSEKGESKTYTVTVSVLPENAENEILSFSITKPNGVKAKISTSIDKINSVISISVTDLSYYELAKITKIVPSIEISNLASISPNSNNIDLSKTEAVKYTVTAGNGETKDYTVTITHELKKFISKWKTTSNNEQIKLPIYDGGEYDFTVDWGDGSEKQKVTSHTGASHTYTTAGEYTVTITEKIEGFNFGKVFNCIRTNPYSFDKSSGDYPSPDCYNTDEIINISSWGDLKLLNSIEYTEDRKSKYYGSFEECSKLVTLPMEAPNLEGVTNIARMFSGAKAFNGNIGSWNVSKVTNMESMFLGAEAFNQNISSWNVSKVTNMESMFENATSFDQNIGIWNVSNVTNMVSMFKVATSFNGNIGSWNVSNVIHRLEMFYFAKNFNQDLSSWDLPYNGIQNFSLMFRRSGMPYIEGAANSKHPENKSE